MPRGIPVACGYYAIFPLRPLNTKSALSSLGAILFLVANSPAAVDLGTPSSSTPYEPYMRPVRQVLGSLHGEKASMEKVKQYLRVSYGFRYSFTEPYVAALPEVTAKTRTGDCKAKSLWLVSQMQDRNVRYVIGKARSTSKISHAWVMWNDGQHWWILDPTNTSQPISAERTGRNEYIPLYSYEPGCAFLHTAASPRPAGATSEHAVVAAEQARR